MTLPDPLVDGVITWSSDDPDEPAGEIALLVADQGVGAAHADFEMLGFTPPDGDLRQYRLSDYLGQVVILDYFATW